mmetsp:Transcript_26084/g.43075  ORF Transcript_26084/g.43075 Transcript_26084/m.43075 type:complete len:130 (-) Transcript_26084:162-551(-)
MSRMGMCRRSVSKDKSFLVATRAIGLSPSWLLPAKTARVGLVSGVGEGSVSAQIAYATESKKTEYELGYSIEPVRGKLVSATITPANNVLKVEMADSSFEPGATWKGTTNIDARTGKMSKVTITRAWNW